MEVIKMNKYEAVIIFTEKFNDELAKKAIVKYSKILHGYSPKTPIGVDNMGKKRLAYPIREQKDGWYLIFKFNATTENIMELERLFRIDDDVLKFIVVKQDDDYEIEDAEYIPDSPESEQDVAQGKPIVDVLDIIYGLAK